MRAQTICQAMHAAFIAKRNCEQSGNVEWLDRWQERLNYLVRNFMPPSGSGWDCGTEAVFDQWSATRLVFRGAFHHMNDGGYYDGWTEHTIIVSPSFDGIDLRITGRNRNYIKDVIHDDFYHRLTMTAPELKVD